MIDKCEYLFGEEILSPQQYRVMYEDKFTCPPLEKTLGKQTKTTETHNEKQVQT